MRIRIQGLHGFRKNSVQASEVIDFERFDLRYIRIPLCILGIFVDLTRRLISPQERNICNRVVSRII